MRGELTAIRSGSMAAIAPTCNTIAMNQCGPPWESALTKPWATARHFDLKKSGCQTVAGVVFSATPQYPQSRQSLLRKGPTAFRLKPIHATGIGSGKGINLPVREAKSRLWRGRMSPMLDQLTGRAAPAGSSV
jgi:hypothetical protein